MLYACNLLLGKIKVTNMPFESIRVPNPDVKLTSKPDPDLDSKKSFRIRNPDA
jgi:hypothetical protein